MSGTIDSDRLDRLFVYGSLKAEGTAHHLLAGAHRERDGCVAGYERIECNGYPMLRRGRDAEGVVEGEVYAIAPDLWPGLDHWEEVPSVYQRCQVRLRDGRMVWLYCEADPPA